MKAGEHTWLDISEKAEKKGIGLPVLIEPALLEKLKPSPYLSGLGITVERRIENLLNLVRIHLPAEGREKADAGQKYYLPFMVLKGPLVYEDLLPVIARLTVTEEKRPSITLFEAEDTE
jgi:hypothetical protein